ncbi:siderophore-interacting protein [Actinoplanes couchii]|uniref:Siderophore-interacting protein n=1 Tax=Actinoplanes couchii TaxID=403638 RepID=A0ABQ3XGL5_9ACTN|nr:siderophore-interacting protein [Actinoplanes couchii]MDR6321126.1 NADPH-dependent ferric siderophore reductase [Actinoplanes couchii]GID57639.1 siderophore-interacting protein [Actinoplanes couchii]
MRPWEYSAFPVRVTRTQRLSPGFVRVTLAGDSLRHFASWGLDQRIKLVLPMPHGGTAEFGLLDEPTPHPSHWYARWRALPPDQRNVLRTYTPAAIRPEAAEIDVDFVIHEPAGPASAWALAARPGDELVVTGPDARMGWTGYGICWTPGSARDLLIIGDETAFPAIRNIIGSLDGDVRAQVLIEVGAPGDDLVSTSARDNVTVRTVLRDGVHGRALEDAVRAVDPGDDPYIWIAGESGSVTRIRQHLTRDRAIPKDHISFLGYWKLGGALVI